MPQTFVARIENDPDGLYAVVATIQFAHVTKFDPRVPHARDDATRHAEISLQRDIYLDAEFDQKVRELEIDVRRHLDPGEFEAEERIRKKFAEIRAIKMPELPEAKRHNVREPVRLLRFITGVLLSTFGGPPRPRTDARVHIEIVPVRDEMPTP